MVILKQPHRRALRLVGLGENLDLKRLALLDAAGQRELLHRSVPAPRDAQRNHVNRHAQGLRRDHRGKCITHIFVAIGQQHQPLLAGFGKRRRAKTNGRRDVRPLAGDHRLDFLVADFVVG